MIGRAYNLSETGEHILVVLGTPPLAYNYRVKRCGGVRDLDSRGQGSIPCTLTMKKETYKNYVRRMVQKFKRDLFLHEWTHDILWAIEDKQHVPKLFTVAEISTNLSYLRADITFYPQLEKKFNNGKYSDVAETILHELCHVYTEPLYKVAYDLCAPAMNAQMEVLREQATQRICGAIFALIPDKDIKPV